MAATMAGPRIHASELAGRVTDVHAHVGVSLKAYANSEYPYAQSLEGLHCRQKANGVDYSAVFTYTAELFFDLPTLLREGRMVPAAEPLGEAPYALENRLLFIKEQLAALEELAGEAALDALPPELRRKVASSNTAAFLFGGP
jgi:hypothetical protein